LFRFQADQPNFPLNLLPPLGTCFLQKSRLLLSADMEDLQSSFKATR